MSWPTCYWPNGDVAKNHTPCTTASGQSSCCDTHHYCFDNGLCFDNANTLSYQSSCTDQNWESTLCATYCLRSSDGSPISSRWYVWPCDYNGHFACSNYDCGTSNSFTVRSGTVQRNPAVDSALNLDKSGTQTPSSNSSLATALSTECPASTSVSAGLGAGLGTTLLMALIALAATFTQLRKHQKRSKQQTSLTAARSYRSANASAAYTQLPPLNKFGWTPYAQEMPSPTTFYNLHPYRSTLPHEMVDNDSQPARSELDAS